MKPLGKLRELQLIAQCAVADNRDAFGLLVEAYQPHLRRFLLNLTRGDHDLADDLAQDAFLKAYISIRSFQGISSFKTWLWRIAYNEFISHQRRQHEALDVDEVSVGDESASVASTDAAIDINACLDRLPLNQRTAIILFYQEGRPIKEISKIMSVAEGTVKSLLSRGRQNIKTQYQS